jgi:hypothetical protein
MIGKRKILSIPLIVLLLVFGMVMVAAAGEPPPEGTAFDKGRIAAVLVIAADDKGTEDVFDDTWSVTISGLCINTAYLNAQQPANPQIPVTFSMPPLVENPVGVGLEGLAAYVIYQQLPGAGPPGCWSAAGGENLWINNVKQFIYVNDNLAAAKVIIKAGGY